MTAFSTSSSWRRRCASSVRAPELGVASSQRLRHEVERSAEVSDLVGAFRRHPESEVARRQLGGRRLESTDPAAGAARDQDDRQHEDDVPALP